MKKVNFKIQQMLKMLLVGVMSMLFFFGPLSNSYAQEAAASGTHCFGKITATSLTKCGKSNVVVHNFQKGGYMACPICTPKCKDYARGYWDAQTQATLKSWAQQVASCGKVKLVLTAHCGTCSESEELRSTIIDLGGKCVTTCDCDPGYTFDPNDENCKKKFCDVPGLPDGLLQNGFFVYHGVLYQVGNKKNCKTECKP